jgi:hypothetical protein
MSTLSPGCTTDGGAQPARAISADVPAARLLMVFLMMVFVHRRIGSFTPDPDSNARTYHDFVTTTSQLPHYFVKKFLPGFSFATQYVA